MILRIRRYFVVLVTSLFLRGIRWLWRVEIVDQPPADTQPHLYAIWHGDELVMVPVFSRRGYAAAASLSKDGEMMAGVLRRLGYLVVRGSSSRGGAGGLKGMVDAVRLGHTVAVAVDGPRGPVFKAKPGIFFLAASTGIPITPAAAFAVRRWSIPHAWNQSFFPKPFSRVVVACEESLFVPPQYTDSELEGMQRELETRIHRAKTKAQDLAHRAHDRSRGWLLRSPFELEH